MTRLNPSIEIVVAVATNGVIGARNDLPFRLSTDLKRFKALTMGKPMIMGRKTFQSIGKALPGRTTIVVTRDPAFSGDGILTASSLDAALAVARSAPGGSEAVMIVGGGDIYRQALPLTDVLHVTHVDAAPEGDTVFPEIDPALFVPVIEERVDAGPRDDHASRYVVYHRRAATD